MTISEYEQHGTSTGGGTPSEIEHSRWLALRPNFLGASEWAGVLNQGFASQNQHTIYIAKVHPDRVTDLAGDHLIVGKLLEPSYSRIAEKISGNKVVYHRKPKVRWCCDYPFLGATLDAEMRHPDHGWIPLELKSVSQWTAGDWSDGHAPLIYEIQLQAQMFITRKSHGCLFTIWDNQPVFRYRSLNQRFIDATLPKLEEFWSHVERKDPPPIGDDDWNLETTALFLKALYPASNGETISLPEEAKDWHRSREQGSQSRRLGEQIHRTATSRIREAMKEAEFGVIGEGPAGYSLRENKHGTRTLRYHTLVKGAKNGERERVDTERKREHAGTTD